MLFFNSFYDIIAIALALVISLVLHEVAHGYIALRNGDPTAKMNGRLSLNPVVHFDLFGFAMLMVVGFGYAKPVPVDPRNFTHRRKGIFTVAIAGVVVNIILAFVFSFLFVMFSSLVKANNVFVTFLDTFFYLMVWINLRLFFFNLLPVFPLDGFRVVESFTRAINPYTKFMRNYGQYVLLALILLSVLVNSFGFPAYFDILGMYISFFTDAVFKGFMWLWGLMF